ncbi:MAG: SufS family cysteine desulfurase [Opitutales bacterium]
MSDITKKIRDDFPILKKLNRGKPLAYLDNAASSQKPNCVIEMLAKYYKEQNSNVHRGIYALAEEAELHYHNARKIIADWFNVIPEEIIFVRGATEALNLVAHSYSKAYLKPGDSIILTQMEHHANIVPWQMMAEEKNIEIQVVPIREDGSLDLVKLSALLAQEKTKVLSLCHISNSLGTINPVEKIIEEAHSHNVHVVVDGAQSVPHAKIDLKAMNCDFFTFSGHKVFGPMGIGVLYGKKEILETLPPYQGGGDMIDEVSFSGTTYAPSPQRFEAGTPNVAGAIGLASAIDYLGQHDMDELAHHENALLQFTEGELLNIPGLKIYGTTQNKASVISFSIKGVHPHDLATLLDGEGVAIRTGHHCCQPLMEALGVQATARASFAFYNSMEEAERFVAAVKKSISILS